MKHSWGSFFVGVLAGLLVATVTWGSFSWWRSSQTPPNTDPRKGRVIIDDNGGWGASPSWKQCADTTLIIHIPGVDYGDRYVNDSPECQP